MLEDAWLNEKKTVHLCNKGIEGHPVHVALWDISKPPAKLLFGNGNQSYNSQWPAVSGMLQDRTMWNPVPEQSYAGARPAPQANSYIPTTMPMAPSNGAFFQTNQVPPAQHYAHRAVQDAQYAQVIPPTEQTIPRMAFGTQHLPVNGTNGVIPTETRGVLIRNLHFLLTQADVRAKFGRIGTVVHCIVSRDASGRSRGSATVKFSTLDEARLAVDTFDGCDWRDRTLQVRLLREGEAVQHSREPVIANGTTGARGTQKGFRGTLRA